MDLPAGWQEAVQNKDIAAFAAKYVVDFAPVIDVVRDTWSKETLTELAEGKIFVSDAVLNHLMKERLANAERPPLKSLTVASDASGTLTLNAKTLDDKRLSLTGTIEKFVRESDKAEFVYKVQKHKLPGHGLTSWIFGNLSLSAAQKLMGTVKLDKDLPVSVKGNTVTVDFSEVVEQTRLAKTELFGQKLIDMIIIEGALVKDGGIEIDTRFNVNENTVNALRRIVSIRE